MRECSLRNMSLITIDTPEKNENLVALLNENFSNIVLTISKEEFIMNMNRFGLVEMILATVLHLFGIQLEKH